MKVVRATLLRPRCLPMVLLVLLVAAIGVVPASAIELSYDMGTYSHYVWRGLALTDGPVFQSSLTGSHDSGFGVNIWGNMDLDDVNGNEGDFNELDLTLSYAWEVESVGFEVGYIEYTFPNTDFDGTRELYISASYDSVLAPSFTLYYDLDEVEDYYGEVGVEYASELNDRLALTVGLVGSFAGEDYASAYAGGSDGGLWAGNLSVALDYSSEDFAFGVLVGYTESLDDDVLFEQPVDFWGGVYLGFVF